ncbi:MAG: MBL fold metallo-hydrolase [Rhodothermales bacterium]|nr:MBL fold metallo-hydrolase [Rhodothermales bacterium]MBO6778581.1 MBL fold metallo-hydrolase [Rhodothermales bacterium]
MLSRRAFLGGFSALSVGAALRPTSLFAVPQRGKFTPIRRGVGTFEARGGTTGYLISPDALVVIDSQYPETAEECWQGLQERAGDRRIDVLANTHHHGDHTAGNIVLSQHADRHIAHAEAARLHQASAEARGNVDQQRVAGETYQESLTMDVGDEVITLTHHGAAHTGGDSVIHLEKADVVHMGDLVFNRMPPFIDKPGGASIAGWMDLLEATYARFSDDTIFIHGHAGPNYTVTGTREDLLVMRDFLSGLLDYVQAGIRNETPLDELAVDRLPDFPEYYLDSWATAIPNAIRAAHQELTEGD